MSNNQEEYVRRQVAAVTGFDARLTPELEAKVFYELTRTEEFASGRTDQWGNWEWPFCRAQREGLIYRPWLDEAVQAAVGVASGSRWPGGRQWALCLTHDVDLVSKWDRGISSWRAVATEMSGPRDWRRLAFRTVRALARTVHTPLRRGDDPLWCYERWLEAEERFGFKSSMLFFASRVDRRHRDDCYYRLDDKIKFAGKYMTVKGMMAEMARRGWDIGIHGSCHTWNDAELLAAQRREIEEACGQPVLSTRQHYLRYSAAKTPAVHAQADLKVDSTQGFNRNIGFRAGTSFPYWCWDHAANCSLPVLEVPMQIMDTALFSPGGLEYDVDQAVTHCVEIMERVRAVGGCLTMNFHPNYVREERFWKLYNLLLAEAARREPWCATLSDVYSHRVNRESLTHN